LTRSSLARRWSGLDHRIKMTLRVSVLAAVLVNAGTAWAFHEYGRTGSAADAPRPAVSPAADPVPPLAEHG
jgi:hypothetical protein